jgi:unsaturated rhamnogalacturonyl hydrolase
MRRPAATPGRPSVALVLLLSGFGAACAEKSGAPGSGAGGAGADGSAVAGAAGGASGASGTAGAAGTAAGGLGGMAAPHDGGAGAPPVDAGAAGAGAGSSGGAAGATGSAGASGTAGASGAAGASALDADVVAIMRKVADWQLPRAGALKDWIHGALWTGIMATYDTTHDAKYLDAVKTWGGNWSLTGGAAARGDDQCAAQVFFEAYLQSPTPANLVMVNGARASFDALVANPPKGRVEWWWQDALFMVPPGFARLGAITGDKNYFAVMNAMWWDTYAYLFSPQAGLMYRDNNNRAVFWSRGNGWVVAGIARVLQFLPTDDPKRADFVTLLKTMLAALKPVQGDDGLWRSNLLGPANQGPETSGTGFITFAMAWAINHGVADRATYLPVVRKAWQGLVGAVNADGKLGYVQNVGLSPGPAGADETHEFGVGAFLLAGSEVAKL